MPENVSSNANTAAFPQEWITSKTIKTISGASLCCWLITLFFDLICFMPVNDRQLHTLLVLIVSTISSLGLAVNKVFSSRSENKKTLWLLVVPNAMLIYIHALGFQVATKELAIRANANELKKAETTSSNDKIAAVPFLRFLTQQTSWIPSLELVKVTKEFNIQKEEMQEINRALQDSIITLNNNKHSVTSLRSPEADDKLKHHLQLLSDSINHYSRQYKQCIAANNALQDKVASMNSQTQAEQALHNYNLAKEQYIKRDSVLTRRIEEKNTLINKWNTTMLGLKLPKADMERVMNGYMGDENYYRKLFKPMPTNTQ